MITNRDIHFINLGYFEILRRTDDYIEIMSKNTRHCWIIHKHKFNDNMKVYLYHKHKQKQPYYHRHWQTYSVKRAVESIISHDNYVISRM